MILLRTTLWVVPHLVVLACLIGLLPGSRYRAFPLFSGYLLLEEIQFLFLFNISLLLRRIPSGLSIYQWGVVFNVAINSCMQIAVLYEIASDLILSRSSIATTVRPLVRWVAGLLLLLAIGLGAGFSGSHIERVVHAFEVLNFCANAINIGLLLALIMLTRVLHISWQSLSIGIVLGFAIDSSAEMGGISFISALGFRGVIPGDLVRMLGFSICTLVWMVYILLPEKQPILVGREVQKSEIESWNEELQKIVRR